MFQALADEVQRQGEELADLRKCYADVRASLDDNTDATRQLAEKADAIASSVAGVVEAFSNLTSAFKVLGWIGKLARPLGYIAAAGVAITTMYATIRGIVSPR